MGWDTEFSPLHWLAQSIHLAVAQVHGEAQGYCFDISVVGSFALSTILEDDWTFSAGSLLVETCKHPADGGLPIRLEMNGHNPIVEGLEFHCWNVWVPKEYRQPTETPLNADEVPCLYIDFSSAFYRQWADNLGLPWTRGEVDFPLVGHPRTLNDQDIALNARVGMADLVWQQHQRQALPCVATWKSYAPSLGLMEEDFRVALAQDINAYKSSAPCSNLAGFKQRL